MSERRGVLSAGTWCVDFNKSIARWPDEDTSNEVLAIDRQGGGAGFNMALDLKRLDPELPVEAMGVVGDDELARFLFAQCDARGVNRTALRAAGGGATMSVDAFNVAANGRRTHFYHQGVAAEMTPDDFDFSSTKAKILHLGLPGAHKAMDRPWRDEANGWVAVVRSAGAAGLFTNLELMTTRAAGSRRLARPGRARASDWRSARGRLHALGGGSFSRRRHCGRARWVAVRDGLGRPAGERHRRRQRRRRRIRRRHALRAA